MELGVFFAATDVTSYRPIKTMQIQENSDSKATFIFYTELKLYVAEQTHFSSHNNYIGWCFFVFLNIVYFWFADN